MIYRIDDKDYEVIIDRKNNKNTYIRIKEDLKIHVTCNYFVMKNQIIKLLDNNIDSIKNMLEKQLKSNEKKQLFFYLGNKYDIIVVDSIEKIDIDYQNKIIYIKGQKQLEKWYKDEIIRIFTERFNTCFKNFQEVNRIPQLKIRYMKSRWGVYNRSNHSITLNTELIKYDINKLDYVIYHELSHIIHFDHSKYFWNLVSKYCPNYKLIRKELKD